MFGAFLGKMASSALPGLLGGLFGGGDKGPSMVDLEQIGKHQARTQELVDKQLKMSEDMMDPTSDMNQHMRNLMSQRAMETGAQSGNQAMKMAAMSGVSPGQAMMAQRQAQNAATGKVNQDWLNAIQGRFGQGLGLMGNMTQMQQGLDQNIGQAYISNITAQNAAGGAQGGAGPMDALTEMGLNLGNIGGKSHGIFGDKGGFMSHFGTGSGWLSNLFG
jgi:hypothetical protein